MRKQEIQQAQNTKTIKVIKDSGFAQLNMSVDLVAGNIVPKLIFMIVHE